LFSNPEAFRRPGVPGAHIFAMVTVTIGRSYFEALLQRYNAPYRAS
jgi:hypothetical protein